MIIDNKGKLFGKINIVDLAVILVVIVAIVGVVLTKVKLDNSKILSDDSNMLIKSSAEMDKLEIELKVKEVRDVTRDAIIVGDDVYQVANDKFLGTVARVESTPAMRDVKGDNGTVYVAEVPDRYDVTIVVETEGKKKDDGFYTESNVQILYGREMEIKTSTVQTMPTVAGVTVVENEK